MNRMNSTRFMEVEEMKKNLTEADLGTYSYPSAGIPLCVSGNSAYMDTSDSHSIVFGATGSKKTRMLVMPTINLLCRAGESFVVTDPKGEVFARTSGMAESMGYSVFVLNFRDYAKGHCWNPLRLPYEFFKKGDSQKTAEMVSEIADMMLGEFDSNDAFWFGSAKDVCIGLVYMLMEEAKDEREVNIKSLINLWNKYRRDKKVFRNMVKEKYVNTVTGDKLQILINDSEKTVGSVEAIFQMAINRFSNDEKLMRYISLHDIDLSVGAHKKTAAYIIIPDEIKYYYFLVSLFISQHYETMIREAQESSDHRLPIRMNYVIDEFANLPRIEVMDCMITASRSRNIRFDLIVQGMSQLKDKYGDMSKVICGNCNNWIYLYSKEYELLAEISRLCGDVIYENSMRIPLISEFDLQHLSKEKGEALILSGRNLPCIANLRDIDDYPFETLPVPQIQENTRSVRTLGEGEGSEKKYVCTPGKRLFEKNVMPGTEDKNHWILAPSEIEDLLGIETCTVFSSYKGMILKKYSADAGEVRDGSFIMKTSATEFSFEEAVQVEWFSGSDAAAGEYMDMLKDHPGRVYITLNELRDKGYVLEPVENVYADWLRTRKDIEPSRLSAWESGGYKWHVTFAYGTDTREPNVQKEFDTEYYPHSFGLLYAVNRVFRQANAVVEKEFKAACDAEWESDGISLLGKEGARMVYDKCINHNGTFFTFILTMTIAR